MSTTRKTTPPLSLIVAVLAVTAFAFMADPASAKLPRLYFVPEGANPVFYQEDGPAHLTTIVNVSPVDRVCTEVWLSNLDADTLRVPLLQFKFLTHFGYFEWDADCSTIRCDHGHPDYLQFHIGSGSLGACDSPPFFAMGVFFGISGETYWVPNDPHGGYLLDICWDIGVSAIGSYEIVFQDQGTESYVTDESQQPISTDFDSLTFCVDNQWGDPTDDGTVNIFDLLCVLQGFSNDFSVCPKRRVDLAPCGGDGSINIFDLLEILALFSTTAVECCDPL